MRFLKVIHYNISSASHHTTCFEEYGRHQMFKIVVCWKYLSFCSCSPRFLVSGSIYELVYPIVMGCSSCCVKEYLKKKNNVSEG
jgi:hypothetical protein